MRTARTSQIIAAIGLAALVAGPAQAMEQRTPAEVGQWRAPFAEPTINGKVTDEVCIDEPKGDEAEHDGTVKSCKVAATSIAVLGADDVVYWNGLEDTEEVEMGIAAEYGEISTQDQVRRLDLATRTWRQSDPDEGKEIGDPPNELVPGLASQETYNDDVLFCAALAHTSTGKVLSVGGTTYYAEPDLPGRYGVVELQGSKATRGFDPETNSWVQYGDMTWGRWYPTLIPLADGDHLVLGGVGKLMKPAYTDRSPQDSGRNVVQSEVFDVATGEWTENDDSADRTLPLYPRTHLLPGGGVFYNAGGQVYNPQGQAYDQALWNMAAVYDQSTQSWTELGIPGLDSPFGGFRGSATSLMLPLRPDADGNYTKASFLTAGGIVGTTPGTYFAVADSRINTVDTTDLSLTSEQTGSLNAPRWYGQSVLLPTGEVFIVNGASADEVVGPGTAIPVMTPELWDPATGEWTPLASQTQARTYHNSAALLHDGTVIVGGHDPISTGYGYNFTIAPGTTTPNETRNPTFEIFEPPYLHRGERPVVKQAPASVTPGDKAFTVTLDIKGDDVESVMLMRKTAITHLVDGGQRAVELPIVSRNGSTIKVATPTDASITPAGPYLLFVNRSTDQGPVPSVAAEVEVLQGPVPTAPLPTPSPLPAEVLDLVAEGMPLGLAAAQSVLVERGASAPQGAAPVAPDLAFHETAELHAVAGIGDHTHDAPAPTAGVAGMVIDEHGHVHALGLDGLLFDGTPAGAPTVPDRTAPLVLAAGLVVLTTDLLRRWRPVSTRR